jgi:diguanylate cyclase (GGDEF)-like protein
MRPQRMWNEKPTANLFLTSRCYILRLLPMELDVSAVLDAPKACASVVDTAFELLPFPAVILDGALRLRLANAKARTRLNPPAADEDPYPPFDKVLARSGRIPVDVRLRILSCCGAEVRDGDGEGRNDAVFPLASGHTVAVFVRPLGDDRWMVVLQDRRGRGDPDALPEAAHRDSLTEIGNRRHIETKLTEALADDGSEDQPAILVFDIDRFRSVNDQLGWKGGDALLRAVVGRVRQVTREADQIARLDGDTFAVLQNNGEAADNLAPRLVDLLGRPYLIRGEVMSIGVSVGVARAPADGTAAAALLQHADFARHEAKEAGGQTWRHYGHSMADRARLRQELEADLRRALPLEQLSLAYQPRVNLRTRAVTGFEALARWNHPKRGVVPPAVFIPVAEDIGLIDQIGDWALHAACRDAASWPEPLIVSVNVSARQMDDEQHFMSRVATALRESGLPTRRLELEMTEAALTRRPEPVRVLLRDLHELGVRIALDNFGTGRASLRQLLTFPFDTIKIDQSFTRSLASNNESSAVMRGIAAVGTGLGMTVIAEGVETRNQARMAEADGCTEIQGFLVSRPVPAAEVAALLARDWADVLTR